MARPQFSKMLVERRRDLGLTLDQAARVLKMKQQVLTAFEEGDWDHIPRSGYAQGMLSSYSRYLGLNPRNVIDQFKQDLYVYSHAEPQGGDTRVSRASGEHRKLAGYADRYLGQGQRSSAVDDDIDLYGSAGPAGSIMSSGTFDDEMYRRLARDRGGHRGVGYSERYLEQTDDAPPLRGGRRPYTGRVPDRGASPSRRPRQDRSSLAVSKAQGATRSTIQTRAIDERYEDDLRYDQARGYEAASTERGRHDSRHIVEPTRPKVRRGDSSVRGRSTSRGGDDRRGGSRTRGRGTPGRSPSRGDGGRRGGNRNPNYLSFDARALAIIVVVLFVVLMVFVLVAVGSCVSNVTNAEKPQVPVASAPAEVGAEDETGAGRVAGADAAGTAGAAATTTPSNLTGTISKAPDSVTVSVEDGKVSWVEVVMGEVSLVAQTVSGPWEQTYQVTAPMEIQASDASAVRVTADGTPVSFDSKSSGVGIITIVGPEDDADAESQDDAESQGGERRRASDDGLDGDDSSGNGDSSGSDYEDSSGNGDGDSSTGGSY